MSRGGGEPPVEGERPPSWRGRMVPALFALTVTTVFVSAALQLRGAVWPPAILAVFTGLWALVFSADFAIFLNYRRTGWYRMEEGKARTIAVIWAIGLIFIGGLILVLGVK